jgi:hypothetical protein
LEVPETTYNNGGKLKTKYRPLWLCKNCRSKLAEAIAIKDCDAEWLKQPADDLPKITDQTMDALEKMGEKAHGGE